MDRIYAAVENIGLIIAWAALVHRLFLTSHHKLGPSSKSVKRETRLTWGVLLCFTLVITFHALKPILFPAYEWFASIPFAVTAILFMVVWAYLSYEFAPHLRPKWPWPVYTGTMTGAVYIWLWDSYPDLAQGVFCTEITLLALLIVIPAHILMCREEQHPPMRLRVLILVITAIMIPLLTLSDLAKITASTMPSLRFYLHYLDPLAGIILIGGFLTGYLLPARYFVLFVVWVQRTTEYFQLLLRVPFLRVMECVACEWSGRATRPVSLIEILQSPRSTAYGSVVAIFDSRKVLKDRLHIAAQQVGYKLDILSEPGLSYEQIVNSLTLMGRSYTIPFLLERFAVTGYLAPVIETPNYFSTLHTWLLIHALECHLKQTVDLGSRSGIELSEILKFPTHATYVSVMNIQQLYQDSQNRVEQAAGVIHSRELASVLSGVDYFEMVTHLKRMGRVHIWDWVFRTALLRNSS